MADFGQLFHVKRRFSVELCSHDAAARLPVSTAGSSQEDCRSNDAPAIERCDAVPAEQNG